MKKGSTALESKASDLQEALEELEPELDQSVNDPAGFAAEQSCLERFFEGEAGALDEYQVGPLGRASISLGPPGEPVVKYQPARPGATPGWRRQAGNPRAVRAAGQAMARNRFSLIIPCHRVIASDGGLGGYGGGGLGVKVELLNLEAEFNFSDKHK